MQTHSSPALIAIGKYLYHLRKFYECINDNSQILSEKETILESIKEYFTTWKNDERYRSNLVSSDFVKYLTITVESLEKIAIEHEEVYDGHKISVTSIFQTLVVENFFSTIRRKCHYPNLWLYTVYEQRAWMELVKKFSPDCPFTWQPSNKCGKLYNSQHGG